MKQLLIACTLTLLLLVCTNTVSKAQAGPQFQLGFKALADQIPDVVGTPTDSESWGPNGDSLQHTTKGLMAWRKLDNFTAFTNGGTSWIAGPNGVESRPNNERFVWEGDYETETALQKMGQGITVVLYQTLGPQVIDRVEKFTIYDDGNIDLRWVDGYASKQYLEQHHYQAIAAISDWVHKNSALRPSVRIRSYSSSGVGNYLESITRSDLVDAIGNKQAGQGEWMARAEFTVQGQL